MQIWEFILLLLFLYYDARMFCILYAAFTYMASFLSFLTQLHNNKFEQNI